VFVPCRPYSSPRLRSAPQVSSCYTLASLSTVASVLLAEMQPLHVQPRYESDVQQFFLWYRDNSEPGICGYTREPNCTFVPLPKLQELFLDHERTTRLLQCIFGLDRRSPVDAMNLTGRFERIFAILLLIGRGPYIEHFIQRGIDDLRLPFDALPNDIPVPARDPDFFPAFYRCQWQFCAHVFEQSYNRSKLRNETVLPITSIRDIRSGPNVDVVSIVIHPAYNKLRSDAAGPALNDTYVLKRYCTAEAERYFESELDAYRAVHLGGSGESNLVGFYGTFEQHAAYNVLLEFADQGSLLDYFQTAPPVRSDDIQIFWRNFLDLIKTLDSIHKLQPGHAPGPRVLQGSHGHIKPANVLVMNGGSDSKFDVRFKLDVGIEHFMHTTASRDGGPTSRAYEAPECFVNNVKGFPEGPQPEADIWSLGCILSDSVSWVVRGLDGLEEYRVRRKAELQRLGVLTDEYSFHNGETRLQCVDEWHTELFDLKRPTDRFAEPMTQMLTDMLGEFDERPTAKQLLAKSRRLLLAAGAGSMPQSGGRLPRSLTTASGTGSTKSSHTHRDPHGPITPPESLFSLATSRSVPISRRPVPPAQYREQSPRLMLSGPQQTFYDSTADEQDGTLIASPLSYTKSGSSRGMSASTAPSSPVSPPPAIQSTPDSLAPREVLPGMQNLRISSLGSALEPTVKQSTRSGVTPTSGREGHDQRFSVTTVSGGDRHDQPSPLEAVEGSPRPSSSLIRTESTTLPPDYRNSVSAASEGLMHRPAGNGAPESNADQADVAVSPLILPAQGVPRRNPRAAPFLSVTRLHTWRQDMREKSSSITIDTRERIHLLPADKRDHVFLVSPSFSRACFGKRAHPFLSTQHTQAYRVLIT
jgi:hypothetical protein